MRAIALLLWRDVSPVIVVRSQSQKPVLPVPTRKECQPLAFSLRQVSKRMPAEGKQTAGYKETRRVQPSPTQIVQGSWLRCIPNTTELTTQPPCVAKYEFFSLFCACKCSLCAKGPWPTKSDDDGGVGHTDRRKRFAIPLPYKRVGGSPLRWMATMDEKNTHETTSQAKDHNDPLVDETGTLATSQ